MIFAVRKYPIENKRPPPPPPRYLIINTPRARKLKSIIDSAAANKKSDIKERLSAHIRRVYYHHRTRESKNISTYARGPISRRVLYVKKVEEQRSREIKKARRGDIRNTYIRVGGRTAKVRIIYAARALSVYIRVRRSSSLGDVCVCVCV